MNKNFLLKIKKIKNFFLILKIIWIVKRKFKRKDSVVFLFKILKNLIYSSEGFIFSKGGSLLVIRYMPHINSVHILWAINKNEILNKNKIYMKAYFEYFFRFDKYPMFISWRRNKTDKYHSLNIKDFLQKLNAGTILKYKNFGYL